MRVPSVAVICNDCGVEPLPGETESHEESLDALKLSVPVVAPTFTVVGAGSAPPCVAPKAIVVEDSVSEGAGAPPIGVTESPQIQSVGIVPGFDF